MVSKDANSKWQKGFRWRWVEHLRIHWLTTKTVERRPHWKCSVTDYSSKPNLWDPCSYKNIQIIWPVLSQLLCPTYNILKSIVFTSTISKYWVSPSFCNVSEVLRYCWDQFIFQNNFCNNLSEDYNSMLNETVNVHSVLYNIVVAMLSLWLKVTVDGLMCWSIMGSKNCLEWNNVEILFPTVENTVSNHLVFPI